MIYVQFSEGGFQVVYPLGSCTVFHGPGFPELSKSYMDMASKLFIFTLTSSTAGIVAATSSMHRCGAVARACLLSTTGCCRQI